MVVCSVKGDKAINYYQEITIIESPEIPPYCIWSKLYTQVHLALVEMKKTDESVVNIGVGFPGYKCFEKKFGQ